MLSPTRRTFLALGAFAGAQLVCGCTGESHDGGKKTAPDPDLPLRTRAVAATDTLLAAYDSVIAGPGAGQAATLKPLRDQVAEHRAALAQGLPTGSPSPTASASASASAAAVGSPAALAAVERQTAGARLADLDAASPALAKLLAAVSASDAVHAAALGDTGAVTVAAQTSASPSPSPSPSPSGTGRPSPMPSAAAAGLQSALAAEHAAVYGYGVVGAFLPSGPQREDGRASYAAHQARRDAWQRLISTGGAAPVAAAPGYRLPFPVKDAAGAAQLAAHIETQLTAVYADLVGAESGALRAEAADALRETALRAEHWGAALPALPGLADAGGPTASASPSA